MGSACSICGGSHFESVYRGPVRAGRFGSMTAESFDVLRCGACGVDRLHPRPLSENEYESGEYRASVDGSVQADAYYGNHDRELASWLGLIGSGNLRNKVVADIGCGAGSFLDLVKGLSAYTIGIEPQAEFAAALKRKGHRHYAYPADAAASEGAAIDVAVSFQVVEHVTEPLHFLRDVARCLKPGGELHLTTPNRDELLMKLGGESYRRFFYRVAHSWYFDKTSLTHTMERAGLKVVSMTTPHRYDLSNFAVWLRDGRPSGIGHVGELGGPANGAFREQIAAAGMGDLLYSVCVRASS